MKGFKVQTFKPNLSSDISALQSGVKVRVRLGNLDIKCHATPYQSEGPYT